MPLDLSRLDGRARALWAKVVTTAIAAGESQDAAEVIAEKGLTNAGLADGAVAPRDLSVAKTRDGLRISLPVVAITKGPADSLDVFGWGSVAVDDLGRVVVDHQADIIEAKELEAAVYDFAKRAGSVIDVQHDRDPVGDLIESAFFDPRKRVSMGLDGTGRVGWWAGFRIKDKSTIEAVRSGDLPEFSIDASAIRDVLPEDQVRKSKEPDTQLAIGRLRQIKLHMLSLVTAGAGKGVTVELWKGREMSKKEAPPPAEKPEDKMPEKKAMSVEELVSAVGQLSADDKAKLLAALEPKEPEGEPVMAGADTPAAKALAKALESDRASLAKARDELQKLRDEAEDTVAIAKAKADGLEWLPGAKLESLVKSIRVAKRQDAVVGAELEAAIVGAAKALKASLGRSLGSTPPQTHPAGTTFESLYQAEKAANPKEPPAEIQRRLAKAHPDLFATRGGN